MNIWPIQIGAGEVGDPAGRKLAQDFPVHVTVESLQSDECVVQITYRRANEAASLHRFFRVQLGDMSVVSLNNSGCPT